MSSYTGSYKRPMSSTKSSLTWWSRHDPVNMMQGHTDHWTKMKIKSTTFEVAVPSGQLVSYADRHAPSIPKGEGLATFQYNNNGTIARVNDPTFNAMLVRKMAGRMPGSYEMHRPKPTSRSEYLRTSFNERAREGFNYWQIERPKPTKFGRYGIGSANTILGIGNAIRT
ncbi:uncharacterized protein [Diadema antillarum]|uniref:uncharacterized protein n=1 Tax=Diadema antillarum TaxID=105358 RepID=UPI003A8821E1